jgi:3-oxoacyl-[acyl-carrier protein] reductase
MGNLGEQSTQTAWHEQVAIITGGADGLGLALAERLSEYGVRLALFDRDAAKLEAVGPQFNTEVLCFELDVTDAHAVQDAVQSIVAKWGRVDILINCAGITGQTAIRSHEVDAADLERVLKVNLFGSFHTSKAVLPYMLERNYGRILHIASIAGKEGNAGMLAYSASKAAVIGMTKVQGKEYAETGITINALAPAVIRTQMVENMPSEQVEYMTAKIPMKRCGTLKELAAMGTFIVSPEASFTTGFTFDLSGGRATY